MTIWIWSLSKKSSPTLQSPLKPPGNNSQTLQRFGGWTGIIHVQPFLKTERYSLFELLSVFFCHLANTRVPSWCLGFNGHLDTPFEILHVILLGVVKYLYRHIMTNLSEQDHTSMGARWKAFDPAGLNIQSIQPPQMVNHSSSLAGRQFQKVIQAAPLVFFKHIPRQESILWLHLGRLCSYVFQKSILYMQTYLT